MLLGRRLIGLFAAVALPLSCEPSPAVDPNAEVVDERVELPQSSLGTDSLLKALYRTRLYLGIGSPFRLVELAASDDRLTEAGAGDLARALLLEIELGRAGHIDPDALAGRLSHPTVRRPDEAVRRHLLLQRDAYNRGDPVAVHHALTLVYATATAEGLLHSQGYNVLIDASRMMRDQRLAASDAAAAREEARRSGRDQFDVLREWRKERRLRSERPTLAELAGHEETEALARFPDLMTAIRRLADLPGTVDLPWTDVSLTPNELERLGEVVGSSPQIPLAPIRVVLRAHLKADEGKWDDRSASEILFGDSTTSEEELALHWLRSRSAGVRNRKVAYAVLQAVGATRAFAQEPAYHPWDPAPAALDFEVRHGITEISYDVDVPGSLRPALRRSLWTALDDLERVIPRGSFQGLEIHFGHAERKPAEERARYLAFHTPSRVLHLPPETFAGTLGHELAHDLDNRAAEELYATRGTYATAHAIQEADATIVTALKQFDVPLPPVETRVAELSSFEHGDRPQEVFARGFDWFLAAALAAGGRQNGYVSSIQTALRPGYGTAASPALHVGEAEALVHLTSLLVDLPPTHIEKFLSRYGIGSDLRAFHAIDGLLAHRPDKAETIRRLPLPPAPGDDLWILGLDRDVNALRDRWLCGGDPTDYALREHFVSVIDRAFEVSRALDAAYRRGGGNAFHWLVADLAGESARAIPVGPIARANARSVAQGIRPAPRYHPTDRFWTLPPVCGSEHATFVEWIIERTTP